MKKINYMKKCGWLFGCVFAMATFSACSDDNNDNGPETPDITPGNGFTENIALLPESGAQAIQFTAGTNWTAQSNQAWLKVNGKASTSGTAGASQINMTYEENTDVNDRPATITLTAGSTTKTINVSQKAAGRVIAFKAATNDTLKLAKDMKAFNAEILANVEWEYVADSLSADDSQWIGVTVKDGKVAIAISNQDGLSRCARLVFRDKNFTSFTKALFVRIEGWGEQYLNWSLSGDNVFSEKKDSAEISADFTAAVEPRALVMKGDAVQAEKANWVSFELLPAATSALQSKKWRMIVEAHSDVDDRKAFIVLVPADMSDADVQAKSEELTSEVITQTNNLPAIKYGTWRYDFKLDENGDQIKDENGNPIKDYIWKGYVGNNVTFTLAETTAAIQIFANRKVSNLRFVDYSNGTETPLVPGEMGNTFATGVPRDEAHTVVDITTTPQIISPGGMGKPSLSNWMALDLLDENGSKIKTVYLELVQRMF